MIKVRVDWHSKCPSCGTQLVVDFFDDSVGRSTCPWCGCVCEINHSVEQRELRDYLSKAIREVEERANSKTVA